MTSLAPYLKSSAVGTRRAGPTAETMHRVVSLLLQGMALHAFKFDPGAAEAFRIAIRKLRMQMEVVDDDSALLIAGAAIRLLEENSVAAEVRLQTRQNEMEKVIALLSDALLEVSGASEEKMVQFKEIERDIASAPGVSALFAGKERMADAVAALLESGTYATEAEDAVRGETDGVTGLPDSVHGAAAIAEVWAHRADFYIGIFAAERLDTINMRFGFEVGNEVLRTLSQHVSQHSAAGDQLFRWQGPCVVTLMRRCLSESHVLSEMTRIASSRPEHAITIRERDAIVSISTSWQLFALGGISQYGDLMARLDQFAETRARSVR